MTKISHLLSTNKKYKVDRTKHILWMKVFKFSFYSSSQSYVVVFWCFVRSYNKNLLKTTMINYSDGFLFLKRIRWFRAILKILYIGRRKHHFYHNDYFYFFLLFINRHHSQKQYSHTIFSKIVFKFGVGRA